MSTYLKHFSKPILTPSCNYKMDFLTWVLMLSVLGLLLLINRRPNNNYPPGPWTIPLLGSIPALSMEKAPSPHHAVTQISKRYGPVVGLLFGTKPALLVSGFDAVKHLLGREDFSFRPDIIPVSNVFLKRRMGVFFTDGTIWREQRRFTLRHLRDFGFGRSGMEMLIHEEAEVLIEAIEKEIQTSPNQMEKGLEILHLFPVLAINVLWTIVAGKRYELSDKEFLKLTRSVMAFFRNGQALGAINFLPILEKIPIINAPFKRQVEAVRNIQDFVEKAINEHNQTYDDSHMRDFIDVYLREMKEQGEDTSSFSKDQLTATIMDLFNAGTETTASTLAYCLRYMLHYPDVQERLKNEILSVVGTHRLPALADMPNLHYTQATVAEALRHSGLVPFTPPHATLQDTELLGYTVPKGTFVIVNLWSVHMDPEHWGDPEVFRPERFLDSDGHFFKDDHLMLFGSGPRMCLGEPLARNSTVLFFTALIQRFQFHKPTHGPPPNMKQMQGFTTSPASFKLSITRVESSK